MSICKDSRFPHNRDKINRYMLIFLTVCDVTTLLCHARFAIFGGNFIYNHAFMLSARSAARAPHGGTNRANGVANSPKRPLRRRRAECINAEEYAEKRGGMGGMLGHSPAPPDILPPAGRGVRRLYAAGALRGAACRRKRGVMRLYLSRHALPTATGKGCAPFSCLFPLLS